METIIEPTIDFDFTKLYLANPTSLSGGAYFTRMFLNNKPMYIQTPKCLTKQGFIKSGKKIYADLMFNNSDTLIIQWLENLESKCHDLIFSKGASWFDNSLDKSDIETAFTSPIKIYKSGKFYLLRVNVKSNVKIYNENDEVLTVDSIKPETNIISILEIQGIKFTSRYFQFEIELKQAMTVSPDPFLDECFIKKPINRNNEKSRQYDNIVKSSVVTNTPASNNIPEIDLNIEFKEEGGDGDEINDQNIFIETEDLDKHDNNDDVNELTEFNLNDNTIDSNTEPLTLKKPNQVYYKMYKTAREKAKVAKKEAILAFLEAKNIKTTYLLNDEYENESESDIDEELESLYELQ